MAIDVRARRYRSDLSRWATIDWLFGNGTSRFTYCLPSPSQKVDPSGLQEVEILPVALRDAYNDRQTRNITDYVIGTGHRVPDDLDNKWLAGCSTGLISIPIGSANPPRQYCGAVWANRFKSVGCCNYIVQIATEVTFEATNLRHILPYPESGRDPGVLRKERTIVEGFSLDAKGVSLRVDIHGNLLGFPRPSGKPVAAFLSVLGACCGKVKGKRIGPLGYSNFGEVPIGGLSTFGIECDPFPMTFYRYQFKADNRSKSVEFKAYVPSDTLFYDSTSS